MERVCEEANTQESPRGGVRPRGRPGLERGQETRQQKKRPQGWSGQKPQEDYYRQTQRSPATTRTPQERMSAAVASIRARFGQDAIGLGYLGIRYVRVRLEPTLGCTCPARPQVHRALSPERGLCLSFPHMPAIRPRLLIPRSSSWLHNWETTVARNTT